MLYVWALSSAWVEDFLQNLLYERTIRRLHRDRESTLMFMDIHSRAFFPGTATRRPNTILNLTHVEAQGVAQSLLILGLVFMERYLSGRDDSVL